MRKFKLVGNGPGIPGLPHEITDAEISGFNADQAQVWEAALESGAYVEVTDASRKPVRKSKKSEQPSDEGEVQS